MWKVSHRQLTFQWGVERGPVYQKGTGFDVQLNWRRTQSWVDQNTSLRHVDMLKNHSTLLGSYLGSRAPRYLKVGIWFLFVCSRVPKCFNLLHSALSIHLLTPPTVDLSMWGGCGAHAEFSAALMGLGSISRGRVSAFNWKNYGVGGALKRRRQKELALYVILWGKTNPCKNTKLEYLQRAQKQQWQTKL